MGKENLELNLAFLGVGNRGLRGVLPKDSAETKVLLISSTNTMIFTLYGDYIIYLVWEDSPILSNRAAIQHGGL